MMGYSYAKRTDANMAEIMAALRRLPECSVVNLSDVGRGIPDLLVGRHGSTFLLEVKDASQNAHHAKSEANPDGELTDAQVAFLSSWRGCVVRIVHTPEEALRAVAVTELEVQSALSTGAAGGSS